MDGIMITQDIILHGSIFDQTSLSGSISGASILIGHISIPASYEDYIGPYEVTPSTRPQLLTTEDKHLTDDITIEAIPYYEVSNINGGITAIIGRS